MKLPLIRKFSIPVFIILLLLSLTGCELLGFGSDDEEPSISMPLIVKFNEMDSTNIVSVIDSFEVSQPPTVLLENAARAIINPRQLEDAVIGFDGENTSSEVLIFLYGINPNTREYTGPGGILNSNDPWLSSGIIPELIESDNIELNAFFIETIGKVPDEPIRLKIGPHKDSTKVSLTIDPSQHTLPARFALQKTEDDIGPLPPSFMVYVQLGNAKESQPDDPVGLLIRRWHRYEQNEWYYDIFKSGIGGAGYGLTSEQPITDFDYYILVLD